MTAGTDGDNCVEEQRDQLEHAVGILEPIPSKWMRAPYLHQPGEYGEPPAALIYSTCLQLLASLAVEEVMQNSNQGEQ